MSQQLHLLVEWGWDMRHHHEVEMLFEDELEKVSTFSWSCSGRENHDLYLLSWNHVLRGGPRIVLELSSRFSKLQANS